MGPIGTGSGLWCRTGVLALVITGSAASQGAGVPRHDRAPEIRLHGDKIVLPIVMVGEFPFVEGEIAGVRGKLMLDTGADQALAINDHRVPLTGGVVTGTGHFGSGQVFQTRMNAAVNDVAFGSLHFGRATQVASQDATQLEHITPDFLGWIGFYCWQGYAMKLDYARLEATFYRGGADTSLAGEKVIAAIPFETRKLPNHPLVPVRIGDVEAIADFDTGQYGSLFTDNATEARLLQAGALHAAGTGFDLAGFTMNGKPVSGVTKIDVNASVYPASAPIGLEERTVLTIGYGFLSQYKTVWDYQSKMIYLLAR